MSRHRRRYSSESEIDPFKALAALIVLGVAGFVVAHREQIITYGIIGGVVMVLGFVGYLVWKTRRKAAFLRVNLDDERILYMLKGMTPSLFEQEMANMFTALGYSAEVVGGANDGGIDVVAHKDGKKYYIQCKKFMTREVTPHDVRDFLGAITNVNNPAENGFFITTNKFTVMAEKTAEGNPRIELIDGLRLIEYYKLAQGKMTIETPTPQLHPPSPAHDPGARKCPRCGGDLVLRTAHKGDHAGHQFWGCSRYPHCKFIENVHEEVSVH
ncbi:MAG TPA: restriction endonuclease [Candidatus Binatia bacterium]